MSKLSKCVLSKIYNFQIEKERNYAHKKITHFTENKDVNQ